MITGGLNGIGIELTKWFVKKNGVKHLILLGRSPPTTSVEELITELQRKFDANIQIIQADVSDEIKMKSILFHNEYLSLHPIKGIFHLAGTVNQAQIINQNWSLFENVYASKVQGTLILHKLSQLFQLDHFVLFSSYSSVMGNFGNINYAAANAFMDALAYYRHANGLPAQSINWGPWDEVGMAKDMTSYLSNSGLFSISIKKSLNALKNAMKIKVPQLLIADIDWKKIIQLEPNLKNMLSSFITSDEATENKETKDKIHSEIIEKIMVAKSFDRKKILIEHCKKYLKKILQLPSDASIDEEQGFFEMGMDSLMSMELRNELQLSLGVEYKI
jgi:short-subunit dehydrogenase/acyl carrier protein